MERDELFISRIEDCIRRCADGCYVVATRFLDAHEQALATTCVRRASGIRTLFYGGYEEAERRMLVCIPTDYPITDEDATAGLAVVLHIEIPRGSRVPGHRDYLGSVLALGLDRNVTGDILVREDGADMVIVPEIADFLLNEYRQVAHTEIKTSLREIGELVVPEAHIEMISDTVSSVRLDNVISSAFRLSRSKAADAIRRGLVSVDHAEVLKPDAKTAEGSVLVLRGKGKAVLAEVGGESKKGRIRIRIKKYI